MKYGGICLNALANQVSNEGSIICGIGDIRSQLRFECSDCGCPIEEELLNKDVFVCPECHAEDISGVIEYRNLLSGSILFIEKISLKD